MKDFIIGLKDFIIGLGAVALSVALRVIGAALIIIAILAVVLGAGSDVAKYLTTNVTHAPGEDLWQRLVNLFWGLTEIWQAVVLFCVFFWALKIRRDAEQADSHAYASKLALVTLLDYFDLQMETEGTKKLADEGAWSLIKQGFADRIVGLQHFDDANTAKAMRHREPATFSKDLRA